MEYRIQYTDIMHRQSIIEANKDKSLIEEQNIIEGNFLIFSDEITISINELNTLNKRIEELEDQVLLLADSQEGGIL